MQCPKCGSTHIRKTGRQSGKKTYIGVQGGRQFMDAYESKMTAVNNHVSGVIAWVLGDHSSKRFKLLWQVISCWHSYFYVIDGYPFYSGFISDKDHIVSQTYMTRVEGKNSLFRHNLARHIVKHFAIQSSKKC